jgi:putative ABC transport system permease protein
MKIFFSEIRLVVRGLLSRKGRSFLTILGIVIGVAGVIIIIALGAGAQSLVLGQVTKLGTNLISIQPGKSNEKGPPSQLFGIVVTSLLNEDADALKDTGRVPHVSAICSAVQGADAATWENMSTDVTYVGTEYSYPDVVNITLKSGRFFDQKEDQGNANVVVLGSSVADNLFGESGVNPVGEIIKVKSVPFRIVGVISERGSSFFQNQDDQIFIPLDIAQKQLLGIHYVQSINIKVDDADNVNQTIADVKSVLMERHRIKSDVDADFTVRNIADAVEILSTITNALRLFLLSMASIALVVGGIGILNIMLVTVAERTREIGLRKAVGATNSAVKNQFLLEAAILTSLGGFIGIILGILVSYLVSTLMKYLGYDWAFIISPTSVIMAVGVSILTGVVFGLYPAFKASKLNPIEALRYE